MSTTPAAQNVTQHPATVERQGLVQWAASKFGVEAGKVFPILKATCFRGDKDSGPASDAEVAALMIVAREHGLNPFLKEIYAFPDKRGGIVPVVGIDGWIRIVNEHPEYNGVEFIYEKFEGTPAWVECHMYRKDRGHPIKVREFLAECKRETGPWKSHPARMLRHKAFIQCARVAFGFAGIFDPDEGEAIVEGTVVTETTTKVTERGAAGLKQALLSDGIDVSGGTGGDQPAAAPKAKEPGTPEQRGLYITKFGECKDSEILNLLRDEANLYTWSAEDEQLISQAYQKRLQELGG